MPQVKPSWRNENPNWRWLSRILCFFGIHHWFRSSTLKAPIACVVCPKKTKHWTEYRRRVKDAIKRSINP
jgi:hypothetical protein